MDYFYTPVEYVSGNTLSVTGDELHHLSRVMRKAVGDMLFVSSGSGVMYVCEVEDIRRDEAVCTIRETYPAYHELSSELVLVQGILKNPGKMDFIVEKATELGVTRIIPVQTAHTVARGGKVERWRALALAAMKQCGRCVLPVVDEITSLENVTIGSDRVVHLVFHEAQDVRVSLEESLGKSPAVVTYIGPEGGFSDDEVQELQDRHHARIASLGSRRLRSETAAITALARIAARIEQPQAQ